MLLTGMVIFYTTVVENNPRNEIFLRNNKRKQLNAFIRLFSKYNIVFFFDVVHVIFS